MRKRGATVRAVGAGVMVVLIGVAATVATSWGAELLGHSDTRMTWPERGGTWPRPVPKDWPAPTYSITSRTWYSTMTHVAFAHSMFASPHAPGTLLTASAAEHDWGFPFRALGRCEVEEERAPNGSRWISTTRGAWSVQLPLLGYRILPLSPLWPGFALNTLFYALLAWGLWQLPLALRRRSRTKRGACVRCGYDLKGLPAGSACPECGGKR